MEKEMFCKNCGSRLVVKQTASNAAAAKKRLTKQYYYTAYYLCPKCKKLYHDEKFKVVNEQRAKGTGQSEDYSLLNALSPMPTEVEIWTDGACIYNGTPRARAAWAFVSGTTELAGLVEGKQTNNVAEGLAIYHALLWAAEKGYKKIKLHTDSQISLFNLNKHHSLVKVNQEIFKNIAAVIDKYSLQVSFIKVLGHSGDPNNDRVDKLANDLARNG